MYLCKNLKFSIEKTTDSLGDDQLKIILEDALNLKQVDICCEVNVTTPGSRRYHLQEAIVISLRRLIGQAVELGMINLTITNSPGVVTNLNMPEPLLSEPPATGSMTELDAS